jgi:N6-L-threonylcarbamoyladenine synthase
MQQGIRKGRGGSIRVVKKKSGRKEEDRSIRVVKKKPGRKEEDRSIRVARGESRQESKKGKYIIVLGIESTAHTLGIGIISVFASFAGLAKMKVLANERALFKTEKGGMIPSKVAQHHIDESEKVIKTAVKKAGINLSDLNIIAYSESPGIGHSLRIGAMIARTLALKLKKPLIGVNHCIAHLEISSALTKAKDPILLYVSGANTQVIAFESGRYRIFGETLDIGVGNFIDSFARALGLGFPGGPEIYKYSLKGKKFIQLPYAVKGMDVSFGGMLTNLKQKIKTGEHDKADLCYSAQETAFSMLIEVAERALAHCEKRELVLGGGVACNLRLQEMAKKMCAERKAKCYILRNEFNVDNGVMIAWLGYLMHKKSKNKKGIPLNKAGIHPYIRTDEVEVYWR